MIKFFRVGFVLPVLFLTLSCTALDGLLGKENSETDTESISTESDSLSTSDFVDEDQAGDLAWKALEPYTNSSNRATWEVIEARQASGGSIAERFEGEPAPGCPGPEPVPNQTIDPSQRYWFVHFEPLPSTPIPQEGEVPPTAPPIVPEPFIYQAFFLLHPDSGQIFAIRIFCVIY